MKRLVLIGLMVFLNTISTACAEDLLIQVTSVVEGRTTPDGKPIVVDSVEVIATPGSSFRTKIKTGDEWTVVKGKLSKPVDGKYRVEYEQNVAIDRHFSNGVVAPEVTTVRTSLENIEIEKPALIGRRTLESRGTDASGKVNSTSTKETLVRAELVLKPAKDHYDDWPPAMIGNVPVNSSP